MYLKDTHHSRHNLPINSQIDIQNNSLGYPYKRYMKNCRAHIFDLKNSRTFQWDTKKCKCYYPRLRMKHEGHNSCRINSDLLNLSKPHILDRTKHKLRDQFNFIQNLVNRFDYMWYWIVYTQPDSTDIESLKDQSIIHKIHDIVWRRQAILWLPIFYYQKILDQFWL